MYNLDFSQLKRIDHCSIFVRLPGDIEDLLESTLPETSARLEGAVNFCWHISGSTETLFAGESRTTRRRESFLRASLAEFISIEETLQRDLPALDEKLPPFKLTDSSNPLLHLMRELRNLEIHLSSSKLVSSKIPVLFAGKEKEITNWIISDLTTQKFEKLRNAKKYRPEDILQMIEWFNEAQLDWGVTDLLFRSICEVAEMLATHYSLRKYQLARLSLQTKG